MGGIVATLKKYGVAVLVVLGLLVLYHGFDSYRHFTWQTIRAQDGTVYAVPSWRK